MSEHRKRIVLHVGLQKTGSTTLQSMFRKNDRALRSVGVLYPGPDIDARLDVGTHHRAYFCALTGAHHRTSGMENLEQCRAALAAAVDLLRSDDALHTLLISHEALARRSSALDGAIVRDWSKEFDVSFVLYVRPMREWFESFYAQTVWNRAKGGSGAPMKPLSRQLRKGVEKSLATTIRDDVARVAPGAAIDVRSFAARRRNDDLIKHFIEATIPQASAIYSALEIEPRKNESRHSCNIMFLYKLLESGPRLETVRAVTKAMTKLAARGEAPLASRSYCFLSNKEFAKLEEVDREQAKSFPDLELDAPVRRGADPASDMSADECATMLDWLKPRLSDAAYDDASACLTRRRGAVRAA